MTRSPRVGLLPLSRKLDDTALPGRHEDFAPLVETVRSGLAARGLAVVAAETCRGAADAGAAVGRFLSEEADLILTLHLGYSLSLEAAGPLAGTALPVALLETTPDAGFGQDTDPGRIVLNDGPRGVADLASVLRRMGKPFQVLAGHVSQPGLLDRAAAMARAACAAGALRQTRALRIGLPFAGMGDAAVPDGLLNSALGIWVEQISPGALANMVSDVSEWDVAAEVVRDKDRFEIDLPEEAHARSVRVGLGLRRTLESGNYGAFTLNFLAFQSGDGPVDTVPFLGASKAMGRGIGYAAEGDVLAAALVGALQSGFGKATPIDTLCPDWQGGTVFLSQMGVLNPQVVSGKPRLVEKPFPYTAARNPAVVAGAPAPGPAAFVNLALGPQSSFGLIVAPVEILDDTTNEAMRGCIRGWMRPRVGVARFLETFSRHGGTHHSALVLGDHTEAIGAFARFAGLHCVVIA